MGGRGERNRYLSGELPQWRPGKGGPAVDGASHPEGAGRPRLSRLGGRAELHGGQGAGEKCHLKSESDAPRKQVTAITWRRSASSSAEAPTLRARVGLAATTSP